MTCTSHSQSVPADHDGATSRHRYRKNTGCAHGKPPVAHCWKQRYSKHIPICGIFRQTDKICSNESLLTPLKKDTRRTFIRGPQYGIKKRQPVPACAQALAITLQPKFMSCVCILYTFWLFPGRELVSVLFLFLRLLIQ